MIGAGLDWRCPLLEGGLHCFVLWPHARGLRRFGWRLVDESRRVRYGFEARLWNRLAGEFANSVSAIVDSTESPFDLGERDAIDSVFIRLNVQIVQAGGLVA